MQGTTFFLGALFWIMLAGASHQSTLMAQEPTTPPPLFRNLRAVLALGQDDRVYLASTDGESVLRSDRDGSNVVIGKTGYALTGATANKDGLMGAGHAHFSHSVGFYDADFNLV